MLDLNEEKNFCANTVCLTRADTAKTNWDKTLKKIHTYYI